eukprot:5276595-Amphidinium_carterae.2
MAASPERLGCKQWAGGSLSITKQALRIATKASRMLPAQTSRVTFTPPSQNADIVMLHLTLHLSGCTCSNMRVF